jgi:hypothetical protein
MTDNSHQKVARGERSAWRWIFPTLGLLLLLFFLHHYWSSRMIQQRLNTMREQGLPVTPQELDASYSLPVAAPNGAHFFGEAFTLSIPADPNQEHLPIHGRAQFPEPGAPLPPEMMESIQTHLELNRAALELLHRGAAVEQSRYPIDLSLGWATLLPHLAAVRGGAQLLSLESFFEAHRGNDEAVVRSLLGSMALSESISNEPLFISQLVRIACHQIALSSLERALSLLELRPNQLLALEEALSRIDLSPGIRKAYAGESCIGIDLFQKSTSEILSLLDMNSDGSTDWPLQAGLRFNKLTGIWNHDLLFFLEASKRTRKILDLPFPERIVQSEQLEAHLDHTRKELYFISGQLISHPLNLVRKEAEVLARINAARSALAVERYRRLTGSLPENLKNLVPDILPALPQDPFDGEPVRFRRAASEYVVYSIGPDRIDQGGHPKPPDQRTRTNDDVLFILQTTPKRR